MVNEFNVRYTNKDIVEKIEDLTIEIATLTEHIKETNGKIKLNTKMIWGSFGFTLTVLLALLTLYYG
tara:strand:- start:80 stop:280 length:201 start_codon:yes stop_codon:yes gene_type:complete